MDFEDFINGIKVLNSIALINQCIDDKFTSDNDESVNDEDLIESLTATDAHLQEVNKNLINLYKNLFFKLKAEKLMINDENNNSNSSIIGASNLLLHSEIQDCITNANVMYEKEYLSEFDKFFMV